MRYDALETVEGTLPRVTVSAELGAFSCRRSASLELERVDRHLALM